MFMVLLDNLHPVYIYLCALYLFDTFHSFDFSTTLRTPLRSSEDFLVKLLGLRRGDLWAGQLGVDVVRDGPHRGRQSAAAAAQVAGRQLRIWGEAELDSWKRRLGMSKLRERRRRHRYQSASAFEIGQGPGVTEAFHRLLLGFLQRDVLKRGRAEGQQNSHGVFKAAASNKRQALQFV